MFSKFWLVIVFLMDWKTNAEDVKCNISKNTLVYIYNCRLRSEKVTSLYIQPSELIEINCLGIYNANDMALPEINFGKNNEEMRIYNCPIPNDGFGVVMQKFHIEKLRSLSFHKKSSNDPFQVQHFQGLESIKSLKLTKTNITHLDGNIFSHTPLLDYLELNDNNLLLYDGQFKNLPLLSSLHLSRNSITYLPQKVFLGLKNLLKLRITSNKIQTIEQDVFRDLISLEDLYLDFNYLHKIDTNVFEYQGKLEYLDFEGNMLEYISPKVFKNCTQLGKIQLRFNNRLFLENKLFSELLYLNFVDLKNSDIKNIPGDIFTGSVNLYDIDLQYNKLKFLPKNIFKDLSLLKKLYLNNNEIETLHTEIFTSLKNLQILHLHRNLLSTVNEGLLKNLDNLEELNLSFNQIHTIYSDIFSKKVYLTNFRINENRLDLKDFLPHSMKDCKNIKILDFSSNSISVFPLTMVNILIDNAKYGDKISYDNQFDSSMSVNTGSEPDIWVVTNMKRLSPPEENPLEITLSLEKNNISQIKFDFNSSFEILGTSVHVILSENPIICDCHALDLVINSQRKVDLNEGIIFNYDNLYCNGPQNLANISIREVDANELLCSLNRKCTKNNECDCTYKSATETIIINCSQRNLSTIPQLILSDLSENLDFVKLNKVNLHLEDNLLEKGLSEQDSYYNVTELYLQRNQIKYVTWFPPHIENLNLDDNQLEALDPEVLRLLNKTNIKELGFSYNPWRCDCSTKDFISYLWTNVLKIKNGTNIRCNKVGKALIYLDEEELCPIRTVFTSIITSAILICFIIFSAAVFLFYIYEKEILIWLYARDTCLWIIKEERIDKNKKYDAFVSFAHQDEEFVMERLLPILELGSPSYKFCVHIRDWIPGEYIATQISNSVRDSRRTLIILSPNFIQSIWGRMEFRTAHTSAMKEGLVRVILVIYGDVEMDQLDDELKAYIRTNTYIKWGDPWFWEKLKYALPRTRRRHKKHNLNQQRNQIENEIELHI